MTMSAIPENGGVGQPEPGRSLLDDLKAQPIWLLWRSEPDQDPSKKPRKIPYYPNGGHREGELDCPEDRARLVTYAEAVAKHEALAGTFDGLGLALGPDGRGGYVQGIDLDNIVEARLNDIADLWTRGSCAGLGYVEASPSGKGVHIIGYGRAFRPLGSNASGIETYVGKRFFTFTGRPIVVNSPCRPYDLADYVEQVLSSRHGDAGGQKAPNEGATAIDAKTVTELRSALTYMRSDDRQLWVNMGLALKELGDVGRGLWLDWSQTSEKYEPRDAARQWDSFEPRHTGYQAVFSEAQRQGWVNSASKAASASPSPVDATEMRLLFDDDLDALPRLRWLVKGVIPDAGIGAIYGDSGTYKSFLTLDLLAHVSNAREWFGCRVKGSPAVYVPFEGQGGIPNRIRAWRIAQTRAAYPDYLGVFEPDPAVKSGVAVIMEALNLQEQADRDRLVAALKAQGLAGGVLCIDTLAHASNGIEENSSAMGQMIGIFRDLQQQLGGVILLVHHSGKDQSRGMRGWSGLHAAMDFVVECQREGDEGSRDATFRLAKVKDGTTGTTHKFRMELVAVGVDEDGDAETSLVLRHAEAGEQSEHPFKVDKASIREIDAKTSANDDAFIDTWARTQVLSGNYPSKNSLKSQLPDMKATGYVITQDRVLAAVERLLAEKRLVREAKSPNGNAWLRPEDKQPGGSTA